jgi:hypothetical protein
MHLSCTNDLLLGCHAGEGPAVSALPPENQGQRALHLEPQAPPLVPRS